MRLRLVEDNKHGDWVGLYVDGDLVEQGHSLDWPWILKNRLGLDLTVDQIEVEKISGRLPETEDEYLEAVESQQEREE